MFSVPGDGDRAFRRSLDRRYLERASILAKEIKLADVTDNASDVVASDPKFAKRYLSEGLLLIDVLKEGNYYLYDELYKHITKSLEELAV